MAMFQRWLAARGDCPLGSYDALWRWSVTEPERFWRAVWGYFDVLHDGEVEKVLRFDPDRPGMLGARWFDGARVNYAEHLLRYCTGEGAEAPAFHHLTETRPLATMTRGELLRLVERLAAKLRALGVRPGDRVVSYMPNTPETAAAMIATLAVGAVWSSAAIEFGARTVVDRFGQIAPKVLFVADGYRFNGRDFNRAAEIEAIAGALPTLQHIVWLPYLKPDEPPPRWNKLTRWADMIGDGEAAQPLRFERVANDHPLWIVFSSGTTGLPKPIVHGHAGMLAEHLKLMHLHINLGPGGVMFFYSTTGWMMWNLLVAALLTGAAAVLYDGSPIYTGPQRLWRLAADTRASCFGASPTFVQGMEKQGLAPGRDFDLSALHNVVLSGAPSTPETFAWFYSRVKQDLWVTSQSGGTEICSGFVGAVPTLPVYAGEIQARMLGMNVRVWNENGEEVVDQVGELVVTSPFPSMPLRFWNDGGDCRYREAYFAYFPGVWRHGDFIRVNARGGCYIYGRSDSTLNRYGVRIGSAEIYRCVEDIEEVADSLIVCCELSGGRFFMPLFVKLKPGCELTDALKDKINDRLRRQCSPRHTPDIIYRVDAIPYTLTGKKMEVPVRKILQGVAPEKAASRGAMAEPGALDWYENFASEHSDYEP